MTWADDPKNRNDEPKKSELLPSGDSAKEITDLLAEMYRTAHNSQDVADDDRAANGQQPNEDGRLPE